MGFKEAIQEYGKEITASFVCGGTRYADDLIVSMTPHFDGKLFSSVMRCLDIQLNCKNLASTDASRQAVVGLAVAGQAIVGYGNMTFITDPMFGVKAMGDTEYSYKTFGTYIIKSEEYDDEANTLNLECYDLMLQSMVSYDLRLDYSKGITVKGLLDAICSRLGWAIGYTTFTNSNIVIDGEKFDDSYTFRDVLDQIAQVAAGIIAFKGDALCVLYPTSTGEVIDASNLQSLTIGEKYGPINSVVIARTPQEDNVYLLDSASVEAHGLTEVKIENNQIMDSHRDDFLGGIFDRLNGLQFWLYDLKSFGIGYLDLCDGFILETLDGTQHETIMLSNELQITQGLSETSSLEPPEATETDYKAASTTDKLLNKTVLRVDKQAQEITALVSKTERVASDVEGLTGTVTHMTEVMVDSGSLELKVAEINSDIAAVGDRVTELSEIMVDSDSVDIKISKAVGDINSITTETGYTFDKDGLRIKKSGEAMENLLDNNGMSVTRSGEEILGARSDGVTALNLTSRQFLIVGNNSRFENYNNGTDGKRTACFYIGG